MEGKGGKRRTAAVLKTMIALSLAAAAITAYGLINELNTRGQGQSYYEALSSSSVQRANKQAGQPKASSGQAPSLTESPADKDGSADIAQTEEWQPYVDFKTLSDTIPDIAAWIKIDGTTIDYPVVHGKDNDYYLSRLPDGKDNKMGSIFIDYRNPADFTGANTVIYGHHMKNGEMFGALENYKDQAFYEEHPEILIYTPETDYRAILLAGYVVSGETDSLPLSFKDAEDFESYIAKIRSRSVFLSDAEADWDDALLTLCTCTYNFKNARLILVAKLEEIS